MKKPITATTVIALALGTAAVVAPSATAATDYGLRGEDGNGVIARGDQEASDLPAGSCVIEAMGGDAASGSQAGFTWNTTDTSPTTPSLTKWGVSVAFDNSQDRTFADWYFTNSGNFGRVGTDYNLLDPGQIPSMNVGGVFLPSEEVTHKADEILEITDSRVQRNLNLYAKLTDEKVRQFAGATADNPVRYAWQGHYTKEHPYGMKATQGNNALFGVLVNPWPSENNECNPITTTWDKIENHVITPGEETKVGHINVPQLSDGTTDDSLSRMVVEAYSTDGKFLGTSDKTVGEKTRLRIADNGDVFFTWPDYRDPVNGIADDRSVNFAAIALPRSVEQLQAAGAHTAETNVYGYDENHVFAFESSNSLPRYNTPNEIDKHTITLDDTTKHDPQYEKPTRSIISGIIDDAPSNERKELVYTQVGDMINDLIAYKDKPNNRATVIIDKKYVYEGWTAEFVDPDNGNYDVKVTAPPNPAPGTFAQPVVEVTYSNGSKDRIEIMAIVDPNHTQQMNLAYEKAPTTAPGESRIIDAKLTRAIGEGEVIKPKTHSLDKAGLPAGWTADIDEKTGWVTVTPAKDARNGEQFIGKVTATYPDGTTDVAEVNVTAVSAVKAANYDAKTIYPGTPVELAPIIADKDETGGTNGPAPKRYTFAGDKTTVQQDGITLTINPDTGVITADAEKNVPNGTHVKVPVSLHYETGPVQTTTAEVIAVVAPTRPVPFEVETIFDDTVPAGEARVTREGEQGIESIQPDGSWKVTTPPVNAQVTVGTKPATATATQTWTLPVPFDTERRANPELKPGETRTIQEGKPGERKLTVNVTAEGGKAEIAPETVTTEPVTEIIEYGPDNNARESVTTRTVPFTTKIIYDPELPEGTNRTEQEGKDGTVTTTATQRIVDGKSDGDPVITEEVTDPVEMIVRVGTKKIATDVTSDITQPITPPTRIIYDPELPAGETKEDNPGKDGEKTITITRTVIDGKVGESVITEKVTVQPQERVLRVGTKPSEASSKITWTADIPFSVETRPNSELKPGEIKVIQKGVPGEKTYTADFTAKGNEASVTPAEKQTKDPVNEIIEYGPAAEDTSVVTKVDKPIPFETEIVFDNTLKEGEQVVDQQGETGTEVVTSTQKIVDGKPSGEPEVTTERTKEPTNQIIRVGTGKVDPVDADVTIPFGTRIVFDPNLEPGQEVEDVAGKNGTARVTFKDGKAEVNVITQPVERVVRVGSKPTEHSWTERIPFGIEVRENDQLLAGEHTIVQEGVEGERVHVGDTVTETKSPVDMIVEVGIKLPEQPDPEQPEPVVTEVEIPFGTKVIYDPSLKAGEEVEDVAGSTGLIRVTVDNGESSMEEVRAKVDRVIRVGTKPVEANWTEKVPFEVEIRENPKLEQGKHTVVQEGVPGIIEHVDGQSTIVSEAVTMIIEIGTKKPEVETPPTTTKPVPPTTQQPVPSSEPTTEPTTPPATTTPPVTTKPAETTGPSTSKPSETTEPSESGESTTPESTPKPSETTKPTEPSEESTTPVPPTTEPKVPSGSSTTLQRCVDNATAANSPFMWLIPLAVLGGIGYGVDKVYGPQIAKMQMQLNEAVKKNMSKTGFNIPEPEWMRQYRMQADALAKQFAGTGEKLKPVGMVIGAVVAIAAAVGLMNQACQPDGFDAWFGPKDEGSSKD